MDSRNPWANLFSSSLRQVDLNLLAWKMWCNGCEQPLSLRNLVHDNEDNLQLDLRCLWCNSIISVPLTVHEETDHNLFTNMDGDKENKDLVMTNEDCSLDWPDVAFGTKQAEENTEIKAAESPIEDSVYDVEVPSWLKRARRSTRIVLKTYSKNAIDDVCTIPMDDFDDDSLDKEELPQVQEEIVKSNEIPSLLDPEELIPEWATKEIINKDYQCGYCYQAFETAHKVRKHCADEHIDFQNNVCWCKKKFKCRRRFFHHMKQDHTPRVLCQYCGKGLECQKRLDHHIEFVHIVQEPVQCKLCPRILKSEFSFKSHMKFVHTNIRLECDFCKKTCGSKQKLIEHMTLHTNQFRFKCNICSAKFTRNCNLQNHIRNNHNYVCAVCSDHFLDFRSTKDHVLSTHTEEEVASTGVQFGVERITQFVCTVCNRCLATKQALQLHAKTHKDLILL